MAFRILLITPIFYGVEKTIKELLQESGAEVTWIENKTLPLDFHGTRSKFKIFRKIYFSVFSPPKRYLKKELNKAGDLRFDLIFSINAHIICKYLFRKLNSINPLICSVLYLWDSFSMYNWKKEIKLFNEVYTFDPEDSKKYQIAYKPNFFVKNSDKSDQNIKYDLLFAGKFSPVRLHMIDAILKLPRMSDINFLIKLWPQSKILFHNHFIYRLFKSFNFKSSWVKNYILNFEVIERIFKREYLVYNSLNYKELQDNLLYSNVILDIPYQMQSGYTHRLIGALANGRKVLTTNTNIVKEDFFNPEQIHIIDYQHPEIDFNWVKKKSLFEVDNYFSGLELSLWLKSIIHVGIA